LNKIVPIAELPDIGAPLAFERLTANVSSFSVALSSLIATVNVFVLSPGAKVSVPEAAE